MKLITFILCLTAVVLTGVKDKSGSLHSDYMTVAEAMAALKVP